MVHDDLGCLLALERQETVAAAHAVASPAMHALSQESGKPVPHRPQGSDRSDKPSTLRAAAAAATGFAGGSAEGPVILRTRMAEMVSEARMTRIRGCLDGECDPSRCRFAKTVCGTCQRGLHVAECGQFGTARAAIGLLHCAYCRAREMAGHRDISESLMRTAMENMVFSLSSGQESTAQATADLNQLEADFMFMKGLGEDELMMPRHNKERFMGFLSWCFMEAHRGASMTSLWRHMPVIFGAWKITDFSQDREVGRHFRRLQQDSGKVKVQRASTTDEQVRLLITEILPETSTPGFYLARDSIGYTVEAMTGNRLTELYDAGQGHGVALTDVTLVEGFVSSAHPGLTSFIDYYLGSSKTHHPRYSGMVGTTRSGMDVAGMLRRYWEALGCPLVSKTVNGLTYTRGDRWVLRVSLLGFDEVMLLSLLQLLRDSPNRSARANVGATKFYGNLRLAATGPGSEIRKFVNVACGAASCPFLLRLREEICTCSTFRVGPDSRHIVPAPFMVATFGRKPCLMPLGGGGVAEKMKPNLIAAGQRAVERGDVELDMTAAEIAVALWGSHSFRRGADARARAYCLAHGISLDLVDKVLGWKEAEHARDMQLHYEESRVRARFQEALVTWDL